MLPDFNNSEEIEFLLEVDAQIYPTEVPDRITTAIKNIFPSINVDIRNNWISSNTKDWQDLVFFSELLKTQRMLDAGRKVILRQLIDNSARFLLNKQAAFVNKVNFCETEEESPMGPLFVVITSNRIKDLLDIIVPKWEWLQKQSKSHEPE